MDNEIRDYYHENKNFDQHQHAHMDNFIQEYQEDESDYNERQLELDLLENLGTSNTISRFSGNNFSKACQIIRSLRTPSKKIVRPTFSSDDERLLTYELTVVVLKFASFLENALKASGFFNKYPEYWLTYKEESCVLLYDLLERDFSKNNPHLAPQIQIIQNRMFEFQTKIMANFARLRIKYQAYSLEFLLPENMRSRNIDQNPIYAWINLHKITKKEVLDSLSRIGIRQSEVEDDLLIDETFFVDQNHVDLLRFNSNLKDKITHSNLIRGGYIVIQDKSVCLPIYAIIRVLFQKENASISFGSSSRPNSKGAGLSNTNQIIRPFSANFQSEEHSIWFDRILEPLEGSRPECLIITHAGSGRSVAHLACLLKESVPKYAAKRSKSNQGKNDLSCFLLANKFVPRPPLNVIAFGVPLQRTEEVTNFFKNVVCLKNVKLYSDDFTTVSPHDERVKGACAIIVNPPTSGSAIKDPVSYICSEGGDEEILIQMQKYTSSRLNPEDLNKYKWNQIKYVKHALEFSHIKILLYTTCSLHKTENEEVLNEALKEKKENLRIIKSKTLQDILQKGGTRNIIENYYEYVDLKQVFPSYFPTLFNGNFLEIPPTSASSGCFVAIIVKKERHLTVRPIIKPEENANIIPASIENFRQNSTPVISRPNTSISTSNTIKYTTIKRKESTATASSSTPGINKGFTPRPRTESSLTPRPVKLNHNVSVGIANVLPPPKYNEASGSRSISRSSKISMNTEYSAHQISQGTSFISEEESLPDYELNEISSKLKIYETPGTANYPPSSAVTYKSLNSQKGSRRKKVKSKKEIMNRISTPTYASISRSTHKWSRSKCASRSTTANSDNSPREDSLHYGHMCVCARHAKKFPEYRPNE